MLRKNSVTAEQLESIAKDFHHAGLEEKEVVMMEYAQKVVREASSTTQDDFDKLRKVGWSDKDILSITLAAAALVHQQSFRCIERRCRQNLQRT